jgi:hypothetical protein
VGGAFFKKGRRRAPHQTVRKPFWAPLKESTRRCEDLGAELTGVEKLSRRMLQSLATHPLTCGNCTYGVGRQDVPAPFWFGLS